MPVTKIPVVHKFGIISSSQRLELQERLLKQKYLSTPKDKKSSVTHRNHLEISEEFIQLFNSADNFEDREQYEENARKLLEGAKRQCGVKNCGHGSYVNLPLAWTKMAQLVLCKGRIQEECLDTLITSLDVSPLEKDHIPVLFFLAETMLYCLRTDFLLQSHLKNGEIKLLKMGQLTFERLFYHHMAGQLQGYGDSKDRLFTYINGLQECQEAYSPFPNALLSLRFVIEVGKIILNKYPGEKLQDAPKYIRRQLGSGSKNAPDQDDNHSVHSVAISSFVHDLSPTLWHSLDVWRCTNSVSGGLKEALRSLAHCGLGLASETWIDGMVALQILGEAAKSNMSALKILQHLAQGVKITVDLPTMPWSSRSEDPDIVSIPSDDHSLNGEVPSQMKTSGSNSLKAFLSDICEKSEERDSDILQIPDNNDLSEASRNQQEELEHQSGAETEGHNSKDILSQQSASIIRDTNVTAKAYLHETSPHENSGTKSHISSTSTSAQEKESDQAQVGKQKLQVNLQNVKANRTSNGQRAETGSEVKSQVRFDTSSVPTYTNVPIPQIPGITGWHWEVAFTYTEVLASIILYGETAAIQKHALVGNHRTDVESLYHYGHSLSIESSQLISASLMDLAFFETKQETDDGGLGDWNWRIRFGAIQSLVKVFRCLEGDTNREGLRNTAWNMLLKASAMEKDCRVLEARKFSQVHTDIKNLLHTSVREHPASLGMRIAAGLSAVYLPPIPPPVTASPPKKAVQKPRPTLVTHKTTTNKPQRTSLIQEIKLTMAMHEQVPDYNTRKSFDLRRIVEDQWRKELQAKLAEDEDGEKQTLKEKQTEAEQQQRKVAELKQSKLIKK